MLTQVAYRIYLNQTEDPKREYFPFDGYRPGAHMLMAYEGTIDAFMTDPNMRSSVNPSIYADVLNRLFEKFNINHPADYQHRSLSVGDVVEFPQPDTAPPIVFACESIGWSEVIAWEPSATNPEWKMRS